MLDTSRHSAGSTTGAVAQRQPTGTQSLKGAATDKEPDVLAARGNRVPSHPPIPPAPMTTIRMRVSSRELHIHPSAVSTAGRKRFRRRQHLS